MRVPSSSKVSPDFAKRVRTLSLTGSNDVPAMTEAYVELAPSNHQN